MENAIGYFFALGLTHIRRYLSQSQDARVTRSPDLISIPGYSRDSQPAQITIYINGSTASRHGIRLLDDAQRSFRNTCYLTICVLPDY
jgi:hypothetical protein